MSTPTQTLTLRTWLFSSLAIRVNSPLQFMNQQRRIPIHTFTHKEPIRKDCLNWTVTGSSKTLHFSSELEKSIYYMGDGVIRDLPSQAKFVNPYQENQENKWVQEDAKVQEYILLKKVNDIFVIKDSKVATFTSDKGRSLFRLTATKSSKDAWKSLEECAFIVGTAIVVARTLTELRDAKEL
ncbi:hypothetical protein BDR26DRAFT_106119 [Obelidium mucronatum]|nr:hypothetical protein BDR26DRAFT_106119 [Obelidium mucronatum]